MPNVYVEPLPKGSNSPIQGYALELAGGNRLINTTYPTQATAITAAKKQGYNPLVARVRITNKGNPDHWRSAG